MKIALLSIHRVTNYGAILQAFASKIVLEKYGQVNTLDYHKKHLSHNTDLIRFAPSLHGLKMLVHDILNLPNRSKLLKNFKIFNKLYMNLTEEFSEKDLIQGKANNFDVYVCGSDQIWNPGVVSPDNTIDPIFFLSFVKGDNKFSLASSIGHHKFTTTEKPIIKKLLEDFSMISTREKDGQIKLQEILPNRKIYHVLDPSLLLSKNEWLEIFNIKERPLKEKYILVYSVPRTALLKRAVDYFSKKLDLKVYAIDRMFFPITKVDNHIRSAGPLEFVELFANASFIITDSFHGTCFSLNFEKPFACISALERANRQESLLSSLQITDRLMYNDSDFPQLELNMDYDIVGKKLSEIRKLSLDYVQHAINSIGNSM